MAGRIEIDDVAPVVSGGRFPAKAVVGEVMPVRATVWREGHDAVSATAGGALPRHRISAAGRGAGAGHDGRRTGPDRGRRQPAGADQTAATPDVAGPHARHLPRPVHSRQRRAVDVPGGRLGRLDHHLAPRRHGQAGRRAGRGRAVQRSAHRCSAAGAGRHRHAPQATRSADRGRGSTAHPRRPVHPGRRGAVARGDRAAGISIRCANC